MRGLRVLIFLAALALGCHCASARLGESSQDLARRYGPPVSTGSLTGFTRSTYEKESFAITVFYQNGVSVLEMFAKRGLDQATARQVVVLVAARSIGCPDQTQECQIRQASGIKSKDEVFWTWNAASQAVNAAFNPMECTLSFFGDPSVYASVHEALVSAPLAGD